MIVDRACVACVCTGIWRGTTQKGGGDQSENHEPRTIDSAAEYNKRVLLLFTISCVSGENISGGNSLEARFLRFRKKTEHGARHEIVYQSRPQG